MTQCNFDIVSLKTVSSSAHVLWIRLCARILTLSHVIDSKRIYMSAQKAGMTQLSTAHSSEQFLWIRLCATPLPQSKAIDYKGKFLPAQFEGTRCFAASAPPWQARLHFSAHFLWTTLCATVRGARQLFESKGLFAAAQLCSAGRLSTSGLTPVVVWPRLAAPGAQVSPDSVDNIVRKAMPTSTSV